MILMRPAVFNLDGALDGQVELRRRMMEGDGRAIEALDLGPPSRLWARPHAIAQLEARVRQCLPAADGPTLVFAGSGDFHHLTPLLVGRAVEISGEPVTVVHFDNHPDWVKFDRGLHCGSWVGRAARLPASPS